jgi:RNA recognition motif-containing protein
LGSKLFVGNLPYDTDENSLRTLFESTGKQVAEVAIMNDRMTGRPRGFAFVTMASDDDAKVIAGEMNGKPLGGRSLVVNEAQPKAARPPRPMGGPGGGYGGGGYGGGGGGGYSGGGSGGPGGREAPRFPKAGGSRRKARHKRIL